MHDFLKYKLFYSITWIICVSILRSLHVYYIKLNLNLQVIQFTLNTDNSLWKLVSNVVTNHETVVQWKGVWQMKRVTALGNQLKGIVKFLNSYKLGNNSSTY